MRKLTKVLLVLTLLTLVVSASAFAQLQKDVEEDHADWSFGDKGGTWGLVYMWDTEEDEGTLTPYFRARHNDGPQNITFPGAYIADGQEVDTTLGFRLGVNYSPYIAAFHGENRMVGVRAGEFVYDLDVVTLAFDGAYMFTEFLFPEDNEWLGAPTNVFGPRRNDFLLNTKVGILDLADLNVALNTYTNVNDDEEEDRLYDRYVNVAVEADAEDVIPGLDLTGLYAFYSQDEDWLYEVTAEYEVLPETLRVWAGHRNSVFWDDKDEEVEGSWDKIGVVGGNDKDNDKGRYIDNTDTLRDLWRRDNSINVGVEYKFVYDVLSATATAEYDTTNPDARGDFDDVITLALDADALDFNLFQKLAVIVPDEDTENDDRDSTIEDPTDNRYSYELDFSTPKYDLPVPFADEVFAVGRVNFDWDKNYVEDSRNQAIASVELGAQGDVWRLHDLYFGAILAYDLPSEEVIEDAFKYALISRYDAPNGINFRLEYQSSVDYATETIGDDDAKWIHNDNLNDRYDDIRYYDNSKFSGIRFTVGFPL